MKALARTFALLLVLSGCHQKNRELLEQRLAEVELRRTSALRATESERAETRIAIKRLEPMVKAGLEEFPEVRTLEPIELPTPVPPALPALPPESSLEGEEGRRLRERIDESEARLTAFLTELTAVRQRRRNLERQLEAIDRLRQSRR